MMKKRDYNTDVLCRMQANLFANYDSFVNCSPSVFIRRFMNSDLATRFDDYTVLLDISSNETFIQELNEQYGETTFGKTEPKLKEAMFWVGYLYRYWCFVYEIPSKKLIRYVNPKMLLDRYYVYHSMDLDYAIERICEEEKIFLKPNKTIEELLEELMELNENN